MIDSFETHILFKIMQSSGPVLVAFSGGKDSVAMVLYLLEMGVPKERIHLHHHLVDGAGENLFDWPSTESYCQAFADQLGLQLFSPIEKEAYCARSCAGMSPSRTCITRSYLMARTWWHLPIRL